MSTETNDTQPAQETPAETPAAGGGRRERKPPSPEQARLAANRKKLKRQLEKMLASNDAEALERAAQKLAGEEGGEVPASQAEPAALEKSAPAAVEKTATAAKVPTAEETAAMLPLANACFAMVAGPLAGTKFDPMQPRPNPLGGEPIVPAAAIVEALAPVLAKYVPSMVTTPEGQLALALAMWLGPPVVETVKARVMGEDAGKSSAEGTGTRAG